MLAGSICLVISIYMAICFLISGFLEFGFFALGIAVALTAFLVYNKYPARMYLGDSGTLFLGSVLVFLSLHSQKIDQVAVENSLMRPFLILNIFFIPAFDTARVILIRLVNHKSIFAPDRNHIHHQLLLYGLNPKQIAISLSSVHAIILLTSYLFPNNVLVVLVIATMAFLVLDSRFLWRGSANNTTLNSIAQTNLMINSFKPERISPENTPL